MCKKSDSIINLAVSLAKFNSTVQRIEKDSKNDHFKNRYTSLDAILDEVRPLLADQGLSIIQMPSGDGDQLKLTTMLVHISGEWIESDAISMKPTKSDPQGIGSATTYARRYGLCAFLGLSTGEVDDDGNAASQAPRTSHNALPTNTYNPTPTPLQSSAQPPSASSDLISTAQIGMIKKLLKEKLISDDKYREILNGYSVASSTELTKRNASDLIKKLQEYVHAVAEEELLPF